MSLSKVVAEGQTLGSLESMRDSIAADLDMCDSMRDKAALYARLADVLARIDAIRPAESNGDVVDEIAARRSARGAGSTARSSRAKRPG